MCDKRIRVTEEERRERKRHVEKLTRDGKFMSREKEEEARREGERERGEEEMKRERAGEREREERGERGRLFSSRLFSRRKQFPSRGYARREEREEHGRDGVGIFLLLPLSRAYARMQDRRKEDGEERCHERGRKKREGEREKK